MRKNIFYMYLAKFSGLIHPLIVIPIFSRLYTADDFGLLMYGFSTINWLSLFISYGFVLYASREIARNDNQVRVDIIVCDVIFSKLFLSLLLSIVMLLFYIAYPGQNNFLYVLSIFIGAISIGISPIWYFQGKEELKKFASYELIIFIITMALILIVYNVKLRMESCLFLISLPRFIVYFFVNYKLLFSVKKISISKKRILRLLNNSKHLFFYKLSVSFYTTGNVVLLGFFVSPSLLATYATVERVISTFVGVTSPITQSLYPRINKVMSFNRCLAKKYTYQTAALMFCIGVFGVLFLSINSSYIMQFMLDTDDLYYNSEQLLSLMSVVLPIMLLNIVLGVQYLLPNNKDAIFNAVTFLAGIFNVIWVLILVPKYDVFGMVMSVILSEIFVFACFSFVFYKNDANVLNTAN
ncbi:oligosaccharide flippase family protein [Vibrio alginolyticus]